MISLARLQSLLAAFPGLSIGLVGDLFLDRYLDIDPDLRETSVETGLEAYQVTRVRNSPGALGTVMNNLAALGVGRLIPVTVIGDDGPGYDLLKELNRLPVDAAHVLRDADRLTPTYTKPMRSDERGAWRELNRLDLRNKAALSQATQRRVLESLSEVFRATDGLIVLDQVNEAEWGVVGAAVRGHLEKLVESEPGKLIFVDSRAHIGAFHCGVLKPNRAECLAAVGATESGIEMDNVSAASLRLSAQTGQPLFCTLGEQGILVVRPDHPPALVPAVAVCGPIDIVGAGDSATAGIVASLLAGANEVEAAQIGNLVASVTIGQIGTTGVASPEQLKTRWQVAQQSKRGRRYLSRRDDRH